MKQDISFPVYNTYLQPIETPELKKPTYTGNSKKIYGRIGKIRTEPKINRNQPCPCNSGKKYKKCCINTTKTEEVIKVEGEDSLKGVKDGICNRTACSKLIDDVIWFNHSTKKYYCGKCARLINQYNQDAILTYGHELCTEA